MIALSYNADGISDKKKFLRIESFIDALLFSHVQIQRGLNQKAKRLRDLIISLDGFIQSNTSVICPHCAKVCCINRHGYYELEDLIYLHALGHPVPIHKFDMPETDPCQFLSDSGCSLERPLRPFRCNWYFCVPLVTHMQDCRGKDYRGFNIRLQQAVDVRRDLIETFRGLKIDI